MEKAKIKSSFWSKITKLSEEDLKKTGKEIEAVKKEEKEEKKELWLPETSEGKLSLDIYQKGEEIIVKSALAGVKPEDLEITIDKDILTIKGKREREDSEKLEEIKYFHQECFWGHFSRTVILPAEVKIEEVKATLKNGILTINLPIKKKEEGVKKVKIKK
ncbi:MAG: Hsp20/alpha crystallin family protein [Patescibacteria group bacterium]